MSAAACAMVGAMAIGGTMAYLTDNEGATNTFTVGKVQVDLEEPGWDPEEGKDIVPNEEVAKNPQVENTGVNDALIFVTVDVPVKNVTLVAADGTKGTKEPTELFWFKQTADAQNSFADNFNSNWVRLTDKETEGTTDGSTTKYVFAYNAKVAKGATTSPLFDKVQLKNIIENEVTPGEAQNIVVKTYAIQADNIVGVDLTKLDAVSLGSVYDIYFNQNGENVTVKDAATSNDRDLGTVAMTASIDKTEIKAGETATVAGKLGDKVTPIEGAKFVCESGNEAVATVAEDGTITAVKAGSADITVKYAKDTNVIARTVLHVTVK